MKIEVRIHPTATLASEAASIEVLIPGAARPYILDIDFTTILRQSMHVSKLATDFLLIAAVIYACDKAVDRENPEISEDRWTRELDVTIPVNFPEEWNSVADTLQECVGFLTGDSWRLEFTTANREIIQRRKRKRKTRKYNTFFDASAICLFSGGLDSFIGALDWLGLNPTDRLFLVGHYDRDVKGPKHDQVDLSSLLDEHFGNRFRVVHGRIGVRPPGDDMNLRSRSLLFIALATFFGEQIDPRTPIIIPENGPIALNIPLTPSRRGSCSTRTVHPYFIKLLQQVMEGVGFRHPLINPYKFKTKGEMVSECQFQEILNSGYALSRSCAKGGHKRFWDVRTARGCGRCVPCIFRRAALHVGDLDDEEYGIDVFGEGRTPLEIGSDFMSLLTFMRRNDDERQIRRDLVAHGSLQLDEISEYSNLIARMRDEVRVWLSAKAPANVKSMAGIR